MATDFSDIYHNKRKSTCTVENKIIINKPIQEVFDVVTTTQTRANLYPETVSVGGVTRRPFKKGDLILERFLFAGILFVLIKYEVDDYDPPNHITFHGTQAMTNDLMERLFPRLIPKLHGTFECKLTEIDKNVTEWVRMIHFYHSGGLRAKMLFKIYLNTILRSQRKGAQIFVENLKWFMESGEYIAELGWL